MVNYINISSLAILGYNVPSLYSVFGNLLFYEDFPMDFEFCQSVLKIHEKIFLMTASCG